MATLLAELGFNGLLDVEQHYRFKGTDSDESQDSIIGLSSINLFVGKNNAGKSRFLRSLFKTPELQANPPTLRASRVREIVEPVRAQLAQVLRGPLTGYGSITATFLDGLMPEPFFPAAKVATHLTSIRQKLNMIVQRPESPTSFQYTGHATEAHVALAHKVLAPVAQSALDSLDQLQVPSGFGQEHRTYIPVLRGLRPLAGSGDVYLQRTIGDYALPATETQNVFTGLGFFAQLMTLRVGTPEQREALLEYEQFLSAEFFDGTRIELTPRGGADVVHIRIGRGPDFPVFNLGDGMQSMILLTFHPFTTANKALYFIEEPEQHLHPGLQRRVLDLYRRTSQLMRHQYFATTHSNHLLDMAVDSTSWSTYVFRKHIDGISDIYPLVGQRKLALHELGARSSSIFLTNASLWVEGITDRLYIREYLREYIEGELDDPKAMSIREDTHFSFIEYAGANVTHWDFGDSEAFGEGIRVASVCSESMVIADGDIEEKAKRVAELREQLGERLFVLKCKEIENLLPEVIVKAVVRRQRSPPTAVDDIKEAEYQSPGTALGTYLDDKLQTTYFAADSGTIRPKVAFCEKAVAAMRTLEWGLSDGARELCEAIVRFVRDANTDEGAPG